MKKELHKWPLPLIFIGRASTKPTPGAEGYRYTKGLLLEARCQLHRPPLPKQFSKAQQGRFYINRSGFPNWTNQPDEVIICQHSSEPVSSTMPSLQQPLEKNPNDV